MPTDKHGDATAKNVEFGSLLLHQMTALLLEGLAILVAILLLRLTTLSWVVFLLCHEYLIQIRVPNLVVELQLSPALIICTLCNHLFGKESLEILCLRHLVLPVTIATTTCQSLVEIQWPNAAINLTFSLTKSTTLF